MSDIETQCAAFEQAIRAAESYTAQQSEQLDSVLRIITECAARDIGSITIVRDAWSTRASPGNIVLLVHDGLYLDVWIITPTGFTCAKMHQVSQYEARAHVLPASHPQHAERIDAIVAELRTRIADATCETMLIQSCPDGIRSIWFTALPSGQRVREERVI
jgi:hypothetical protein